MNSLSLPAYALYDSLFFFCLRQFFCSATIINKRVEIFFFINFMMIWWHWYHFLRKAIKLQLYEQWTWMAARELCLVFNFLGKKWKSIYTNTTTEMEILAMHFLVFLSRRMWTMKRKDEAFAGGEREWTLGWATYKIRLSTPEKWGEKEISSSRNFHSTRRKTLCRFEYRFLFLLLHYEGAEKRRRP